VTAVQGWVENRPSRVRGLRGIDLSELWSYRELVRALAVRDLKVRYKQAAFGIAWAVIQPLLGAAVFTLVFARLADVDTGDMPYPLFAFVGFAAWTYHSQAVSMGTESLVQNQAMVTKIYYPKLASPLASALAPMVDLAISMLVLVVLLVVYGVRPGVEVLALPLALAVLVAVSLSFSVWLSALNVRYRDVRYMVVFGMQLWLFVSPVAYPNQLVADGWNWVYAVNPMVGVLALMRWTLLDGPAPGWSMLPSLGAAVLVMISGVAYFQRTERRFADVI
jgi:lipopolysaccharide transport system permease protein